MGTFIVGAIIVIICFFAARKLYLDKKSGKSCGSCSGNCSACHSAASKEEKR